MLLPDAGDRPRPRNRGHRPAPERDAEGPAQEGLPRARPAGRGRGAHYQLAVYPLQRKAQLRASLPDGSLEYLKIAKGVAAIKGVNEPNELRLRAFNVTSGPDKGSCHLLAFVGSELVADVTDDAAGELQGRASAVWLGASKSAKGLVGSFDDLVVRVPNPFE